MVGLWPADDKVLQDEGLRRNLGADHYVSSLRDGVVCCLKVATSTDRTPEAAGAVSAAPEKTRAAVERLPLPA
jgi:hypothetical protein